ncbi:MAG TPA: hypothetical protein VN634_01910 [Candidatus Limnocylindrales bacterium]|nr:hypothetical protein [Candidatus Limnocylindrales bacterium]
MRNPHVVKIWLITGSIVASVVTAQGDEQQIAPGTGQQNSVVIDTGADGICNTTAADGDLQFAAVGSGSPNRTEIRCGTNQVVETLAIGDDVQLIALGAACKNTTTAIIDTGDDGIADTTAAGDDTQTIVVGVSPANQACVMTGADGVAQTTAPLGDDSQVLAAGGAAPNTAVVLCGPNLVVDTSANNAGAGDDVQVTAVGMPCAATDVVVNSGADGIATTRAEGPDLRIAAARPARITISPGDFAGSRRLTFKITNTEFGAGAPPSRSYRITTTSGSCGGGVVSQVDADTRTDGLQATAAVDLGGYMSASLVATMKLQNVTTVDSHNPYRCSFDVSVVALDTDPAVDDGANSEGNTTTVDLEVSDRNDY